MEVIDDLHLIHVIDKKTNESLPVQLPQLPAQTTETRLTESDMKSQSVENKTSTATAPANPPPRSITADMITAAFETITGKRLSK